MISCFAVMSEAYADYYKVYSPQVEEGEVSAEVNLNYSGDHRSNLDHYLSQVYGIEYGVTSYWATEISGEIEKSSTLSTQLTTLKWENVFVPFKSGEYWMDTGLYLEVEKSVLSHTPDNIEARLLFEKQAYDFVNTVNISLSQNFGPNALAGVDAGADVRSKYHLNDMIEPGVEYYSDLGTLNRDDKFNRQDSSIGPVVQGVIGEVKYDTGVLFGVSPTSHDVTFKLNLECGF